MQNINGNINGTGMNLNSLPIWLLNLGIIYMIATGYYFIMGNINEDPIHKILEPFPKLLEHYEKEKGFGSRNIIVGSLLGITLIYFIRPFGKYI